MSFWSKKNNQIPSTNGSRTCFEYINKINEQLIKIDNSIVYSKSLSSSNGSPSETLTDLKIKINTSSSSPVHGGRINFKSLQVCTAINKEVNADVITGCVEEISKCLTALKKMILEENAYYENGNNNSSSSNLNNNPDSNALDQDKRKIINSNSNQFVNADSDLSLDTNKNTYIYYSIDYLKNAVKHEKTISETIYSIFFKYNLLNSLLLKFSILDFESRKNISVLFTNGFGKLVDKKFVYIDYMSSKTDSIILLLILLENSKHLALHNVENYLAIGSILEECIKFEQLSRFVISQNLESDVVWKLLDNCMIHQFEISTQSFILINLLFLRNTKMICNEFFNNKNNLNIFIQKINTMLKHGDYVAKRQSIKILSTMIVGRSFSQLMTTYISNPENLKLIMLLFNASSKNLQLEAFNIFKVFVANPNKPKPVCDILLANREKLIKFVTVNFEDSPDRNLKREKQYIINVLEELPEKYKKQFTEEGNIGEDSAISTS
ncbi:hypothetical protein FOG48_00315 [Hanseniaspora uvarum]|nr:hypothetical protein FOG48_00315 [Hanseniaspora uvarum]